MAKEYASELLQRLQTVCKAQGVNPKLEMAKAIQKNVKHELLRMVSEKEPCLVVCGTRKLGVMGRMFLGSTTDFLLHNAPCTVLVTGGHADNGSDSKDRQVVSA